MEDFSNKVLLADDIPAIEGEAFNPIDKKQLIIIYLRIVMFFIILSGALLAIVFLSDEVPPTKVIIGISGGIILFTLYNIIITNLGFRKKGYLVRENDISYQKGLIRFKQVSVPFNRIQHVEVNQGVLARYLKISTLKLFTAGGAASDLSIHGLPADVAQNLKAFLSEKISRHE